MDNNQKYPSNECITSKSLPNVFFLSKSNRKLQLHRSTSLPSCSRFLQEKSQYYKRISKLDILNIEKNKINLIKKKKSNPTIGELLGDDDLYHYQYHNQYSASRFQRKRYRHRSYSRPSHTYIYPSHRKQQRLNYFDTIKESPHRPSSTLQVIESIPNTSQLYLYPTTYSYPPLPAYCYYCYSNMASCCPYLISDCYTGLQINKK